MVEDYPQGEVTFLFTDLVGSTQLWERYPEAMHAALERHDSLLEEVISTYNGRIVKKTGDGIHAAFASPLEAITAAIAGQKRTSEEAWRETDPCWSGCACRQVSSFYRRSRQQDICR